MTLQNLKARAVIRAVARALAYPVSLADKVAKMIPAELNITIDSAIKMNPQLKEAINSNEAVRRIITIGTKLEGVPYSISKHAAGVLITDKKGVSEYVPALMTNGAIVSQFDMTYLEKLGLLKLDILGLKTLGMIDVAFMHIKKRHNVSPDIYELYQALDPKPFELMGDGRTAAIFQLESPAMTQFFAKLKPKNISDVTIGISMYRQHRSNGR